MKLNSHCCFTGQIKQFLMKFSVHTTCYFDLKRSNITRQTNMLKITAFDMEKLLSAHMHADCNYLIAVWLSS